MHPSYFVRSIYLLFPALILALLSACSSVDTSVQSTLSATEMANKYLIVDTHIDVPYRIEKAFADVTQATDGGEFDLPRARMGGLDALFMSIYIPASLDAEGEPGVALANKLIDSVEDIAKRAPSDFTVAHCSSDVLAAHSNGKIAMPMGMENGGPMVYRDNIEHFYNRGIRYVTLAHSKSNAISDSSYDTNEAWQGLSPRGKEFVLELNDIGIMVDISHVSDKAFWQTIKISKVPVIASHSSARHFTPGFHRNMNDEMITALGAQGGVVQINFGSSFVTKKARDYSDMRGEAIKNLALEYERENDQAPTPDILKQITDSYMASNPYPYADLSDVLDHFDHVVSLTGVEHVGIGSDYDGVGDSLPTGLKDVSSYPNLIAGLQDRGYSEDQISLMLGGNLMRVWQQVENYANSRGNKTQCLVAS